MKHDVRIEGMLVRLRPVNDLDASMILELRNNQSLNKFLHSTSLNIEDQLEWLDRYYSRAGDYYFVVERVSDGFSEGVISLYNIDLANCTGEWGRWVLRKGSTAAVESVRLIYQFAFDYVNLKTVYCRTVAENKSVVSFHDSCGIMNKKLLKNHFLINETRVDAIEHIVKRDEWKDVMQKLDRLICLQVKRYKHA